MRRLFCCLGIACVLAGASLMLPRFAFAAACTFSFTGVANNISTYTIVEDQPELPANEVATVNCVPGTGGTPLTTTGLSFALINVGEPGSTATNRFSDLIAAAPFVGTGNLVAFTSDTNELLLAGLTGAAEVTETDITAVGVAHGHGIDVINAETGARFVFISDPQPGGEVPEPSTGLLLGVALPAFLGIGQFSRRDPICDSGVRDSSH